MDYNYIKSQLDKMLVGLDYQKNQLISMYLKHYREKRNFQNGDRRFVTLLVGQSGSGKTALVQALAKATGREFFSISAVSISPEGYKGLNLSEALGSFYSSLKERKNKFESSIIFIDEFDKIITNVYSSSGSSITDQQTYLNLLDSSTYTILVDKNPIAVDTSNMFVILAGAFSKMDQILEESTIDFGLIKDDILEKNEQEKGLELIEGLKKFGFMDEIIGRIGLMIKFPPVSKELILEVLNFSNGVLTKWKQYFLNDFQVDLTIDKEVEEYIADLVINTNLGVRGINQIIMPLMNEANINVNKDNSINGIQIKLGRDNRGLFLSYRHGQRKLFEHDDQYSFKILCPRNIKGIQTINVNYVESREQIEYFTLEYMDRLYIRGRMFKYKECKKIECLFRSIFLYMASSVSSQELNEDSFVKLLDVSLKTNEHLTTAYQKLIESESTKQNEYYDEIVENYEEYLTLDKRLFDVDVKEFIMYAIIDDKNSEEKN